VKEDRCAGHVARMGWSGMHLVFSGQHKHRRKAYTHSSSGKQIQDPSAEADEDVSCCRLRSLCNRHFIGSCGFMSNISKGTVGLEPAIYRGVLLSTHLHVIVYVVYRICWMYWYRQQIKRDYKKCRVIACRGRMWTEIISTRRLVLTRSIKCDGNPSDGRNVKALGRTQK
jgi:hypothetical protein